MNLTNSSFWSNYYNDQKQLLQLVFLGKILSFKTEFLWIKQNEAIAIKYYRLVFLIYTFMEHQLKINFACHDWLQS